MEITSKKEYYQALADMEEILERGFENLIQAEEENLTELGNAISEYEEQLSKDPPEELTERYWIEATDRTDFVISVVQILLEHPAIAQTPELAEKTQQAQSLLFEVYQACASKY